MKFAVPFILAVALAGAWPQAPGHPFDAARITPSIDSFVVVARANGWRPIAGVVQTVARDTNAIRIAVEYRFPEVVQRVEMAMDETTLAPLAHWETARRGGREAHGEVMFRDGHARGAYILSKALFDVPLDTGVVDDDASTALLPALPLETGRAFSFRTFASPGQMEVTRVQVEGLDTVSVPAGRFAAYRLVVMARDTSHVFVSVAAPRRVVLVRLADGSQEMRLVNGR